MSRKLPLAEDETSRTACARALVHAGVDEKAGEVLTAAMLAERVGWCVGLATGMTASLLGEHWNTADVNTLAAGSDAGGRRLPSNAWMALRRLGWTTAAPEGVKVNDRIVRAAQEQARRALRSVKWRADVVAGILATWPVDPEKRTEAEWEAVRAAIPGGEFLLSSVISSRTRQIASYPRKNGRLPVDVFELEPAPRVARVLLLSACDGQQASIERSVTEPTKVLLRLQLPTRPGPQKYADWSWVACTIKLPPTVPGNAVLHFHAKTDQYARLTDPALDGKQAVLTEEIRRVSKRRSHLNDALAWAAARWAVDQAVAAGATVIYLEDLRSMEAGGMDRTQNTRMSQTVRGLIADRMRHLAAEAGVAVVTVPPANTSKHCPHCLTPLRHRKSPDRPTIPGWKWAICPSCRWQDDRDQGAWQRIVARGLTHQTKTVVDKTSGAMVIRKVVDRLEARAVITATPKTSRKDRSKTGPTWPPSNHPAPRRRGIPSPTQPSGPAGKRPEGHAPTDRTQLPRAGHRHQGMTAISTPTTGHRPRGAALGAGFHLHAHATPPRWAEPAPNPTVHMGSLS